MNPIARRLLGAAAAALTRKLLPDAVPESLYRTNEIKKSSTALALRSGTLISRLPESQSFGMPGRGRNAPGLSTAELMHGDPLRCYDPRELYAPPVAPPPVYYAPPPPLAPPRKRRKKITVTERFITWRT